jgi:hypothetical protein
LKMQIRGHLPLHEKSNSPLFLQTKEKNNTWTPYVNYVL